MDNKIFYRVANIETNQGLWYDWDGEFTGLIHTRFDFCKSNELPMEYDEELIGWLSATEELEQLWQWFTKEEVYKLQKEGWFIYAYLAREWKDYDYNNDITHTVIRKESSNPILRILIDDRFEIRTIEEIQSPQRVAI